MVTEEQETWSLGVSDHDATTFVSVKGRDLAQLQQMNAGRPRRVKTQAPLDGINADFIAQMAGTLPLFDN